ncbi:MAG: hypothetical protein AVDCRST_MAG29-741 [uncultured Nocardioidaceae bacterium]|uniref:Uncharacterized protein n=1 Tax=uncultured Nocardioidaceae bacterium TaxID=253824 RepID=A0A6J4L7L5_9ACTN|nr:MAG: hypothetical protein AVDCRST_MAG29-741 [uncultured Nocardioidaceae bacterium]
MTLRPGSSVTDSWGIVLLVLGCPALLALLLMVLTALEDNLYAPARRPEQPAPPATSSPVSGSAGR